MDFYFASQSNNWKLVRSWQEKAVECGHTITYDWTNQVEKYGGGAEGMSRHYKQQQAREDIRGATECTHFVLLWTDSLCGALIEAGMAIYISTPIWIVSTVAIRYTIFWELPDIEQIDYGELQRRLIEYG